MTSMTARQHSIISAHTCFYSAKKATTEEQRSPGDIVHKLFQDMHLSSTLWPLNYQLERKEN